MENKLQRDLNQSYCNLKRFSDEWKEFYICFSHFQLISFDQTVAGENKQGKIGIIYIFSCNFVQNPLFFIFSVVFNPKWS